MGFRLTPRSMTSDDLELYKFKFSQNFADFRTTAKGMKIDQYCQRKRCKQLNALFDIVFLAFICRRFLR